MNRELPDVQAGFRKGIKGAKLNWIKDEDEEEENQGGTQGGGTNPNPNDNGELG